MARSIIPPTQIASVGSSYTVPAGKYAVFAAHAVTSAASPIRIAGVTIATVGLPAGGSPTGADTVGPLVAASGQIISTTGTGAAFGISGFLYDNE